MLARLWRHKFRNWPYLSNQVNFSTWPESENKNLNILRTKRAIFDNFWKAMIQANKKRILESEWTISSTPASSILNGQYQVGRNIQHIFISFSTYFFGSLTVVPDTEGLQYFVHPCNYLSFNNFCWEDHEVLIENLSGLVR